MKTLISLFLSFALLLFSPLAFANTPGQHSVVLTWIDADTTVVSYNVYRGLAAGVCSGTPTPYATGVTAKTYTDTAVTAGTTYVYAVSAVNGAGAESACSTEAQAAVPQTPATPNGLTAVAH